MKAFPLCFLAIMAMSSCGDLRQAGIADRLLQAVRPAAAANPMAEVPGFTAAEMAANLTGYNLFTVNGVDLLEPARLIAANGVETTWESQSGVTAAYDDGILVATRGLVYDLWTASSGQTRAALRAGSGTTTRTVEFIDDQDQISSLDLTCTITPQGSETLNLGIREASLRKFAERCESSALVFENSYWLDGNGDIIASQQYVSPTVAYLRSNRL